MKKLIINDSEIGTYENYGKCSINGVIYRWFTTPDLPYDIIIDDRLINTFCLNADSDEPTVVLVD